MDFSRNLLQKELTLFNEKMKKYLKTDIFLLDTIMQYVVRQKGKQIRPIFVFLSTLLHKKPIDESTYRAAICIEILHTATLIHDDIVDGANQRRSFFSLNALWKNKISVLAGDYLLSKGLLIALENKEYNTLEILSKAVKNMSEAELLQLEKSRFMNVNKSVYLKIIEGKTASLIAAACTLGLHKVYDQKPPDPKIKIMHELGTYIGLIFQIKDDLLDFGKEHIGKPLLQDIKDKKLTLPLIYTLENCSFLERKKIFYTLKFQKKKREKIQWLIDLCHSKGGVEKATEQMRIYSKKAIDLLRQFEDSPAKEAFQRIITFVAERKH